MVEVLQRFLQTVYFPLEVSHMGIQQGGNLLVPIPYTGRCWALISWKGREPRKRNEPE